MDGHCGWLRDGLKPAASDPLTGLAPPDEAFVAVNGRSFLGAGARVDDVRERAGERGDN